MNVLTILTLSGLNIYAATSPVYYVYNYKNHGDSVTGHWYLISHARQNSKRNKCDEYKAEIKLLDSSYKRHNLLNSDEDTLKYVNTKPIINYYNRTTPDPDFFDNTDPRNDEGQWDISGTGNITNSDSNDQNNQTVVYAGDLDDFLIDDKEVTKNANQTTDNNNKTNVSQNEQNYAGELNDFFINNKNASQNAEPQIENNQNNVTISKESNDGKRKEEANNGAGELDDFFNIDKASKEYAGDLDDFFTSDKEVKKDLKESNNFECNKNKHSQEYSGEIDDYFRGHRDVSV